MLRCVVPLPLPAVARASGTESRSSLDAFAIIWEVLGVPDGTGGTPRGDIALEITDATFEAEVMQSDKPVLVDFWAPWCAPCRTVGAVLDQLSGERDDLKIVKINIDDNQDQALKHSVLVLPTVVLYVRAKRSASCRAACRRRRSRDCWKSTCRPMSRPRPRRPMTH